MEKFQNIYDNEQFFNSYKEMRDGKLNANELIEIPTMKSLLPELKGKNVLDLGCGEGEMSRHFLSLGAKRVLAIDLGADNPNNYDGVNLLDKIYPFHKVKRGERSSEKRFADCVFEPNLKGYTMLSINKFDYIFEMGYEYTLKNLNLVKQKLKI